MTQHFPLSATVSRNIFNFKLDPCGEPCAQGHDVTLYGGYRWCSIFISNAPLSQPVSDRRRRIKAQRKSVGDLLFVFSSAFSPWQLLHSSSGIRFSACPGSDQSASRDGCCAIWTNMVMGFWFSRVMQGQCWRRPVTVYP